MKITNVEVIKVDIPSRNPPCLGLEPAYGGPGLGPRIRAG